MGWRDNMTNADATGGNVYTYEDDKGIRRTVTNLKALKKAYPKEWKKAENAPSFINVPRAPTEQTFLNFLTDPQFKPVKGIVPIIAEDNSYKGSGGEKYSSYPLGQDPSRIGSGIQGNMDLSQFKSEDLKKEVDNGNVKIEPKPPRTYNEQPVSARTKIPMEIMMALAKTRTKTQLPKDTSWMNLNRGNVASALTQGVGQAGLDELNTAGDKNRLQAELSKYFTGYNPMSYDYDKTISPAEVKSAELGQNLLEARIADYYADAGLKKKRTDNPELFKSGQEDYMALLAQTELGKRLLSNKVK